ncbi:MAG: hypothetical protein KatS3mg105_1176 [Gemmatales bacterium]|nr:MAG: hypothetical protein KatS3mg105_1176 [Gemmatales bacterium]
MFVVCLVALFFASTGFSQAPLPQEPQAQPIQLEPPGPDRLFRLESEAAWRERMRQEWRQRPKPERITFPEEVKLTDKPFQPRMFAPMVEVVEPYYVCYGRLYYRQKNLERYGWDLGFITPVVSVAKFYWDVATFPYHFGTEPWRRYECSAGECLPGDPVPFMVEPPKLSVTGALLEAGAFVAIFAVFPG